MWIQLFLSAILFTASEEASKQLTIGLLLPAKSPELGIPDIYSSGGATKLALLEVRRRYHVNVTLIWNHTDCNDLHQTMKAAYDQKAKLYADVLIGPPCSKSFDRVAELLSAISTHRHIPAVTWLPRERSKLAQNTTIVGTYGTPESISQAITATLKYHNWTRIGIISSRGELCTALIETLKAQLPNKDIEVRHLRYIDHITNQSLTEALTEIGSDARVFVLCMPYQAIMSFLMVADKMNFTANDYVFLYCRFGSSPRAGLITAHTHPMTPEDEARILSPLLQLGPFNRNMTWYHEFLASASVQKSSDLKDCCGQPDEFAIFLYETILFVADMFYNASYADSVPLYLKLKRNLAAMPGMIAVNDTSGKVIRPLELSHYQHGHFVTVGRVGVRYIPAADIDWYNGTTLPLDSPPCGWKGDECQTQPPDTRRDNSDSGTKSSVIISVTVAAGVVIVVSIGLAILYRKYKTDKAVINWIWKINKNELKMRKPRTTTQTSVISQQNSVPINNNNKTLVRMDTRATMGLGSTSSIERNVLFAPVGHYKGTLVAVKTIQKRAINLTIDMLRDLKALRELQHENLNPFIGASVESGEGYILTKYCSKGSLQDVLENDDIKLDNMFKMSFTMDIARGLEHLHNKSIIKSHGNLKSSNCVIDSRWVVKITDFGAIVSAADISPLADIGEHAYFSRLLWTAPELLRMTKRPTKGTQKGDVYSFAIILQEIYLRCHPYYYNGVAITIKEIISRIKTGETPPYRPHMRDIEELPDSMVDLMETAWQENPDMRPDMNHAIRKLIFINGNRKINIMDNMIKMLEAYSNNLEALVADRTEELALEKQKTDRLLYQMLPPSVAEQLKRGEHVVPETFDEASLFFSDIVGFTTICSISTALQVIDLLNDLYTSFDEIIGMHDVYKVETIGDAYMVASGIPNRNGKRHSAEIASLALDLLSVVTCFRIRHIPDEKLQLRIGLHTGPCASGVVGIMMPRYCLFGDTINMAARMESTGKPFHIHCSSDFAHALRDLDCGFVTTERGVIEVKGKGLQKTYWLVGMEGFRKPLPQELHYLSEKVVEAQEAGRSASPTDTHISGGSQSESTSMYGNAFRRVTNAMSFLRHISRDNYSSVPGLGKHRSGSEVSLQSFSLTVDSSNSSMKSNGKLHRPSEGTLPGIDHDPDYHRKLPTRTTSLHVKRGRSTRRRHKHSLDHGGGASFVIPQIEISSDSNVHKISIDDNSH